MSHEYQDWLRDKIEDNKILIKKYPFLQIKSNGANPYLELDSYENTWLDELPVGWQIGFCEQMCDELMEALGGYADERVILQTKEKFGKLCVYYADCPGETYDKIESIISKYEDISEHTCVQCGKPSTKFTTGWILPVCDDCYDKLENRKR